MTRTLLTIVLVGLPVAAAAQAPPPAAQDRLIVERLDNRFVAAGDYKVTQIDGETGQLAGAYAGWLGEDQLLIGGAAYWLADGPDDAEMTYGGLVIGWNTPAERKVQFGARGLVGVGRATLGTDVVNFARFGVRRDGRGAPAPVPTTQTVRRRAEEDFFVFEPQLTLAAKLTDHIGITVGAGYRLTGFTEFFDDRLRGVSGSVALQLR
jgi:hypothetical protein